MRLRAPHRRGLDQLSATLAAQPAERHYPKT
jgi:hypothetical protein